MTRWEDGAFGYPDRHDVGPWHWMLHFVASRGVGAIGHTAGLLAVQQVSV